MSGIWRLASGKARGLPGENGSKAFVVCLICGCAWVLAPALLQAEAKVGFSEIMYHPVEEPVFNTNGLPALDLSEDVHEYIELYNWGTEAVPLSGWSVTGEVTFQFTNGPLLAPGGLVVVAGDPQHLLAVSAYGLSSDQVVGPWQGRLDNSGGTLTLRDVAGKTVESVTYSAKFPWPIGADGLGAGEDWLGFPRSNCLYRGRSLERVSFGWPANDAANWVASPLPGEPSPGHPNAIQRAVPKPVVVGLDVGQTDDGQRLIRRQKMVRVQCLFSSAAGLSGARVEYFVDDLDRTNETRTSIAMLSVGEPTEGRFLADLPGQVDRAVVRFRIHADLGEGDEVVSPRAGDPFAWHSYFVSPVRTRVNPAYDVFISSRSLTALSTNIAGGPTIAPDPPGRPRPSWNATEPAVFVADGVVYDVRIRYHGSIYLRSPGRRSYHVAFPRYRRFDGRDAVLLSDKDATTQAGHAIFREVGLPIPLTLWIDLYLNKQAVLPRLQMDLYDEQTFERYYREQVSQGLLPATSNPGSLYKAEGVFEASRGPYGPADGTRLPARGTNWTALQRYQYTYGSQFPEWIGHLPLTNLINDLWVARSNRTTAPSGNQIAPVRRFLEDQWNLDKTLTYLSVINWMCAWDDRIHNYFLWRGGDGRWSLLPWDFDSLMTGLAPMNFARPAAELNYFKQTLMAGCAEDFKQRAWWLNNSLLHADNLSSLGLSNSFLTFAKLRLTSVNNEAKLGVFPQPLRPTNLSLVHFAPATSLSFLRASSYAHTTNPISPHAATIWSIRHSAGTYYEPLFLYTSTNDLAELALPASLLRVGETYFWRCTYIDALGHPSVPSAETSFVYGRPVTDSNVVVLNEIMAENHHAVSNGGRYPDWVELYNLSANDQALDGYTLTDDLLQPERFSFPPQTAVPAHGYLVVWCDADLGAPGLHTGFALASHGETLALFGPSTNGLILRDIITFGLQLPDYSLARQVDGGANWTLGVPTPAGPNQSELLARPSGLRLNEWMTSGTGDDWLELVNLGELPVDMGGLSLTDDLGNPSKHTIPMFSFIAARGFTTFLADCETNKGASHVSFRLSAQGGALGCFGTNGSALDLVLYGTQPAGVSQGRVPDGSPCIYLLNPGGTPGSSNLRDSDGDGMADAWEVQCGLDPFDPADAQADPDQDGSSNLEEYLAGTDPHSATSVLQLRAELTNTSDGPAILLRFTAAAGHVYEVQCRDSLDYAWHEFAEVPAPIGARLIEVPVRPEDTTPQRFYRVLVQP